MRVQRVFPASWWSNHWRHWWRRNCVNSWTAARCTCLNWRWADGVVSVSECFQRTNLAVSEWHLNDRRLCREWTETPRHNPFAFAHEYRQQPTFTQITAFQIIRFAVGRSKQNPTLSTIIIAHFHVCFLFLLCRMHAMSAGITVLSSTLLHRLYSCRNASPWNKICKSTVSLVLQ